MRLIAGAILALAGAVLGGAAVVSEVIYVAWWERSGANMPRSVTFGFYGSAALIMIGVVVMATGLFIRDEGGGRSRP
jgi:hypothetical protein